MSTYKTTGIILKRIDYSEADRIYTILTPEGKVSAIAKGVRRLRAKLASHLELFSEIELMLAKGKNLDVITSARIKDNHSLSEDYERLRRGFLFLEMADKLSDTKETGEVYECLREGILALVDYNPEAVELAYKLRLLSVLGQSPQLDTTFDTNRKVEAGNHYNMDLVHGGLVEASGAPRGRLSPEAVKLWRLCLSREMREVVKISGIEEAARSSLPVCDSFYEYLYDIRFKAAEM